MSFITLLFPSHGFGLLDLNAVTMKTSPEINLSKAGQQHACWSMLRQALNDVAERLADTKRDRTENVLPHLYVYQAMC